ncbi:MAG: D-alanyl-D-alanine carboxypeptidase [Clostridia bacterium]|nr:D-alanyl-D-alanine carboxypeptidase [Clostridia bacterium]
MKKIVALFCTACMMGGSVMASGFKLEPPDSKSLTTNCKSAYLIDSDSGECIYKENEKERMPIASVCKVMTLTLCLDAVNSGKLSLDDMITASDNAAGMGGSQVFLGSGCQYKLDQLLKSIVICSANDSCVAVSETVAGNEESFVAMMNQKATELGCNDTLFANCTGLPKPTQYSCAHDVAIMFRNLLNYESYFNYSKIWLEDFVHPDNRTTSMTNTNKLLRKYSLCDGGKTGFTNEAGFCLAATAKKDNMRLISVVLGADNSDNRFSSTINMFNFGFANYKNKIILDKDVTLNDEFAVSGGQKNSFAVCPERNCYVFSAVNETPDVTHKVIAYNVKAPVAKGQIVGLIEVYKNGVLYDTVNVVSAEDVKKAGFGDNFRNISENWAI